MSSNFSTMSVRTVRAPVGRAANRARDVCVAQTAGSQGAREYSPAPGSVQRRRGHMAPPVFLAIFVTVDVDASCSVFSSAWLCLRLSVVVDDVGDETMVVAVCA